MKKVILLLCLVSVFCPLLLAISQQGTMNISGFYTTPAGGPFGLGL